MGLELGRNGCNQASITLTENFPAFGNRGGMTCLRSPFGQLQPGERFNLCQSTARAHLIVVAG
jgi:hypothetical protein